MSFLRFLCLFIVAAVVAPLVGFDLTHVLLVPLALGAGLVACACLTVNAKSVAGPAFAWTCALVGACVTADIIKVQVLRAFSGINGWLLLAGVVAAGTLALVAQLRGATGTSGKANKTSIRGRAVVVEPEGMADEEQGASAALVEVEVEPDIEETERIDDDELDLFSRSSRHGR